MLQAIPGRSFHKIALPKAIHFALLQQPLTKGCLVTILIVRYQSCYVVSAAYVGMLTLRLHWMANSCGCFESEGCIHGLSCHDLELGPTHEGSDSIARYNIHSPFIYTSSSLCVCTFFMCCHYLNL